MGSDFATFLSAAPKSQRQMMTSHSALHALMAVQLALVYGKCQIWKSHAFNTCLAKRNNNISSRLLRYPLSTCSQCGTVHPQHVLPCLQSGISVLSRKMSHEGHVLFVAACDFSSTVLQLFCSQWFLSPHCSCLLSVFSTSWNLLHLQSLQNSFQADSTMWKGWIAGWYLPAAGHTSCFGPA